MSSSFPKGKPVFFSPLATFSLTPDIAKWDTWNDALGNLDWINIGTRKSHYPADTAALVDWQKPLHEWCNNHENPIKTRMTGEMLKKIAKELLQ